MPDTAHTTGFDQDAFYDSVLREKYCKHDERSREEIIRRVARGLAAAMAQLRSYTSSSSSSMLPDDESVGQPAVGHSDGTSFAADTDTNTYTHGDAFQHEIGTRVYTINGVDYHARKVSPTGDPDAVWNAPTVAIVSRAVRSQIDAVLRDIVLFRSGRFSGSESCQTSISFSHCGSRIPHLLQLASRTVETHSGVISRDIQNLGDLVIAQSFERQGQDLA